MSASISALIPELQPFCRDFVDTLGELRLNPRITSTRRSHAEQTRLYRRYLQGLQPYYVAPPGTSPHEYGYAFDLVCTDLEWAGQIWLSWGGEWGGRSTRGHSYDPVHFQYPGFTPGPLQGTSSTVPRSDLLSVLEAGLVGGVENVAEVGQFFVDLAGLGAQFLK